jgi:hypothetical protein
MIGKTQVQSKFGKVCSAAGQSIRGNVHSEAPDVPTQTHPRDLVEDAPSALNILSRELKESRASADPTLHSGLNAPPTAAQAFVPGGASET